MASSLPSFGGPSSVSARVCWRRRWRPRRITVWRAVLCRLRRSSGTATKRLVAFRPRVWFVTWDLLCGGKSGVIRHSSWPRRAACGIRRGWLRTCRRMRPVRGHAGLYLVALACLPSSATHLESPIFADAAQRPASIRGVRPVGCMPSEARRRACALGVAITPWAASAAVRRLRFRRTGGPRSLASVAPRGAGPLRLLSRVDQAHQRRRSAVPASWSFIRGELALEPGSPFVVVLLSRCRLARG